MSSKKNSSQAAVPLIDNRLLPKPMKVPLGEPCSITVDISGLPAPVVRWQVGRKRVKESTKYQMKTDGHLSHTLVIARTTEELDQGVWVMASNGHGEDCCHIEITTHSALEEVGVPGLRNQRPPISNSPASVTSQSSLRVPLRKKKTRRIGQTQSVTSLDAWNPDQKATISGDRPPSVDDVTSASGDARTTTPSVLNQSLESGAIMIGRRKKRMQAQPTRFSSTDAIYDGIQDHPQQLLGLQDSQSRVAVPAAQSRIRKDTSDIVGDIGTKQDTDPTKKRSFRKKASGSRSSLASSSGTLPKDTKHKDEVNDVEIVSEPVHQTEPQREQGISKIRKKISKREVPTATTIVTDEDLCAKEEGRMMWELFGIKLHLLCKQLMQNGVELSGDSESHEDGTFQKMEVDQTPNLSLLTVESEEQKNPGNEYIKRVKRHHIPVTNLDDLEHKGEGKEKKEGGVEMVESSNGSSVDVVDGTNGNTQQMAEKGSHEESTNAIKVKSDNIREAKPNHKLITESQKDDLERTPMPTRSLSEQIVDANGDTASDSDNRIIDNEGLIKEAAITTSMASGYSDPSRSDTFIPVSGAGKKPTDLDFTMPNNRPKVTDDIVTPETITSVKSGEANNLEHGINNKYNQSKNVEPGPGSVQRKPLQEKESTDNITNRLKDRPSSARKKQLLFMGDDHNDGTLDSIIREKSPESHKNDLQATPKPTRSISEQISATNGASAFEINNKVIVNEGLIKEEAALTTSIASVHSGPSQSEVKADKNVTEPGMIARLPNQLSLNKPGVTMRITDRSREPIEPVQMKNEDHRQVPSNVQSKDRKFAEIKSNSTADKEKTAEPEHDQGLKTRVEPENRPESDPPVVLTTYITHRSRKLQTDLGERPAGNVTPHNDANNSTAAPIPTVNPAPKIPPSTGKHSSASLPPPSPVPRSSKKAFEVPEKYNTGEFIYTGPKRLRSQSAERPALVLVDIDIDGKESELHQAGRASPPTPKTRTRLHMGMPTLQRSSSGELDIRGGNQTDTNDDSYEFPQRLVPHPRQRLSLKPARSEEFLAVKSDSNSKIIPLQRGFLRGSKSVESLGSGSDSFSSKMGRRTLSKEWQVVTVTTTEEILIIDQSKTKTSTVKKREETKNDIEKEKQVTKESVTDSKEAKENSPKVAQTDVKVAQEEPRQTTKLTVKELRDKFLGVDEEKNTQREDQKSKPQKIHSKTTTEELKTKSNTETAEQADISNKELLKDTQKSVPGLISSNEASKYKPNEVDIITVEVQEINPDVKSQKDETQDPKNVTYVSNATIFLKSPVALKEEADKSGRRLEVDTSRPRLNSQDMCTQTEADDLITETQTTSTAKDSDGETTNHNKNLNETDTENICPAVFYEYGEMLSYYLDKGDEDHVETQDPEMELVQLELNDPITATVTETFTRIVLSSQTHYSKEEIDTDNNHCSFLGQTTYQNSNSTHTDKTEMKPTITLFTREKSIMEQAYDNNDYQPTNDPNFITFENEPRVRSINTAASEDVDSLNFKSSENRTIQTETDVDDILIDTDRHHHHTKESSVDDTETEIREHTKDLKKQAEEISDTTQSDATSRNENDASDEESHHSSVSSAPSFDTVIFKAGTDKPASTDTVDEAVKGNTSDKPFNSKLARSSQHGADDTDEDDVLEIELDSTLKTDETDEAENTNKLKTTHDDAERVHYDDDDAQLGAVGGAPPRRSRTTSEPSEDSAKHSQERNPYQPDQHRADHTYEELEEKVYIHSALSRLGTILFLLLAAIIFHFLNHIVGDELE